MILPVVYNTPTTRTLALASIRLLGDLGFVFIKTGWSAKLSCLNDMPHQIMYMSPPNVSVLYT